MQIKSFFSALSASLLPLFACTDSSKNSYKYSIKYYCFDHVFNMHGIKILTEIRKRINA